MEPSGSQFATIPGSDMDGLEPNEEYTRANWRIKARAPTLGQADPLDFCCVVRELRVEVEFIGNLANVIH